MYLVGDVVVFGAIEREYDGRKYWNVTAVGTDEEIYRFSCRYEDQPKKNDTYQMVVQSGAKDCKPYCSFQKVK